MPAEVERCVAKMKGTNKRTGKPFTQSEKWAICTAMHNKKKDASFEEEEIKLDEEIVAAVENSMAECVKKMMNSGKAKTSAEAHEMCEAAMARSGYNVKNMELIFTRDLL
jgi:hypothetical protein